MQSIFHWDKRNLINLNNDPMQRQPHITLAKEQLGWEPKIPLEKGLKNTIEYFKTFYFSF
jgi:nucleoside-diphosphate-sugar epimerase